jgi:hypothetical protein
VGILQSGSLCMRNVISDSIVKCANPLGVDAERGINRSKQKKHARRQPILDLRHALVVQLNADALSVTLSSTRYGSFVGFLLRTM